MSRQRVASSGSATSRRGRIILYLEMKWDRKVYRHQTNLVELAEGFSYCGNFLNKTFKVFVLPQRIKRMSERQTSNFLSSVLSQLRRQQRLHTFNLPADLPTEIHLRDRQPKAPLRMCTLQCTNIASSEVRRGGMFIGCLQKEASPKQTKFSVVCCGGCVKMQSRGRGVLRV